MYAHNNYILNGLVSTACYVFFIYLQLHYLTNIFFALSILSIYIALKGAKLSGAVYNVSGSPRICEAITISLASLHL